MSQQSTATFLNRFFLAMQDIPNSQWGQSAHQAWKESRLDDCGKIEAGLASLISSYSQGNVACPEPITKLLGDLRAYRERQEDGFDPSR